MTDSPAAADLLGPRLMTVAEVAGFFRVDPKTVRRWIDSGLMSAIRTPTGRIRMREDDVRGRMLSPAAMHSQEIS